MTKCTFLHFLGWLIDSMVPYFSASYSYRNSVNEFGANWMKFNAVKICIKSCCARWNGGVIEFSAAKFLPKLAKLARRHHCGDERCSRRKFNSSLSQFSPLYNCEFEALFSGPVIQFVYSLDPEMPQYNQQNEFENSYSLNE